VAQPDTSTTANKNLKFKRKFMTLVLSRPIREDRDRKIQQTVDSEIEQLSPDTCSMSELLGSATNT